MNKTLEKDEEIVTIFLEHGTMQSSAVHGEMVAQGKENSLVTVKRALSKMVRAGALVAAGSARSTTYSLTLKGRIFADVDARQYCSIEPDKRYGFHGYNFDLLLALAVDVFTDGELKMLESATTGYVQRTENLSATIQKKEMERLVIELSWKSSKIEGNTYTLLDTEKLILQNKKAPGHSREEAQMILNHKDAFGYIHANAAQFKTLTRKNLEELHSILVKDLSVGLGLRKKLVGVTGSIYRPLDNVHQISDAVDDLSATVSKLSNPYAKALVALLGISYIQPFEDGNKRTSRLMANALLLAHSLTPLSYRSVDESEYREAVLVFYELNSIVPMKAIFIGQYVFAAQNYAVR